MRFTARTAVVALVLCCPVAAQNQPAKDDSTTFTPKQSKDFDPARKEGSCIIRVRVDEQANVYIQGDVVTATAVKGKPPSDEGSECNQYPPANGFSAFKLKGVDGRGSVQLIEEPDPDNHFRIWVQIRDPKPGAEGYTFRISWAERAE